MRIDVLSKEYPPEVYGGAGVHVAELVRALRVQPDVDARVRCFGAPRAEPGTTAYAEPRVAGRANPAIRTLGVDLAMVDDCAGADLVHSHTWYANMAGHLAGLMHGIPHVVSAHSLEPMRPWKAEQLGGGYALSSWAERTAYEGAAGIVAVSAAMRDDVLRSYPSVDPARVHVVHNGIDTTEWAPVPNPDRVRELGVDPDRPERDLRRPDHPPEGPAALPACRGRAAARGPARAVRRRARHPGDRGRGARPRRRTWPRRAPASCGSPRCCPAPTSSPC